MALTYVYAKEVQDFIDDHMDKWIDDEILDNVMRYAHAANLPKQFIDNIKIEKVKTESYGIPLPDNLRTRGKRTEVRRSYLHKLVNDWKKVTEWGTANLAAYFEYGTKQHWIAPRFKQVLAWRAGHGSYGHSIYFRNFYRQTGDWMYSKGHYVSGLPKTLAMTRGYEAGEQRLLQRIHREIHKRFTSENTRVN